MNQDTVLTHTMIFIFGLTFLAAAIGFGVLRLAGIF